MLALVFIILYMKMVFLYLWEMSFAVLDVFIFMFILIVALIYICWKGPMERLASSIFHYLIYIIVNN